MTLHRKETILEDMYVYGNAEIFYFDKCQSLLVHRNQQSLSFEEGCRIAKKEKNGQISKEQADQLFSELEKCQVYPMDLIPENSENKKGRWKIIIEFEEVK